MICYGDGMMNEIALSALRQDAYSLVDKMSAESLRILIKVMQSLEDERHQAKTPAVMQRRIGIAEGKFVCPDDIDADNELIAGWFEGN